MEKSIIQKVSGTGRKMKKLLTICLTALALQCTAQDILPFTFGPIASMSGTSLETNIDLKDQVTGAGYNIGGFVRVKILMLYAEGEITYATKSVSITLNDNSAYSTIVYKLNGVDASAIAGIKLLGLGESANLRIFAGYNWNNYSDISYSVNGETLAAENVNSNNSSVLAGLGCDIWKFSINAKYLAGLTDLAESDVTEVKMRVVNLSLAYRFR